MNNITLQTTITLEELLGMKYNWWIYEVNVAKATDPLDGVQKIVAEEAAILNELKHRYDYPAGLMEEIQAMPARIEFAEAVRNYRLRYVNHHLETFTKKLSNELTDKNLDEPVNRFRF